MSTPPSRLVELTGPGPALSAERRSIYRQSSWGRWIRGYALMGKPAETLFALILLLLLASIALIETATRGSPAVGYLDALVVLVAGWVLRPRWGTAILIAALLSRMLSVSISGVASATAVTQGVVVALAGVTAMTAAWATNAARRRSELEALYTFARGLAGRLQLSDVADEVVFGTARVLDRTGPGWSSSIMRIEGAELVTLAHVGDEADTGVPPPPGRYLLASHHALRDVAVEGKVISGPVADLSMPQATRQMAEQQGMGTVALVPIRVSGEPFGLLGVSVAGREPFSRDDLRRLEAVAQLAGLAIANALRYDETRQTADRLSALERVKSDFLRLASHELRGPLGVVRGYVSMMADGSLGEIDQLDASAVIGVLQAKVDELARLIDQMLETARIEDDRLQLSLEFLDAYDIAEEVVATMAPLAPMHDVELSGERGLHFLGDRERIATVLTNLVDNAIKYSPAGGAVRIVCSGQDSWITIEVVDHGIGIAPGDHPQLFTRFGRIVTAENGRISGTGLGLWLSRELVMRHGGTLGVRSEPGLGSVFTMALPAAVAGSSAHGREGTALESATG
jgi:signal transduction histidine kinase